MPNYCANIITLSHPQLPKIVAAVERFEKEELLSYFLPEPDYTQESEIIKLIESYEKSEDDYCGSIKNLYEGHKRLSAEIMKSPWYYWRTKNWGTKWDIYDIEEPDWEDDWDDPNTIRLSFCTAWSPPLHAYDEAVKRYGFSLIAYYNEPNMCFCGIYEPTLTDERYDYASGGSIPSELDNMFGIIDMLRGDEEDEDSDEVHDTQQRPSCDHEVATVFEVENNSRSKSTNY
jgi:hypothetical protein